MINIEKEESHMHIIIHLVINLIPFYEELVQNANHITISITSLIHPRTVSTLLLHNIFLHIDR